MTDGTTGVWTKLAGFDTSQYLQNMDFPANNRLRYTGNSGTYLFLSATVSFTCNTTSTLMGFAIAINGVADANGPAITFTDPSDTANQAISLQTLYRANHNDYFEVWAQATDVNTTITLNRYGSSLVVLN
jgi:hypothetical protein